MPKKKPYTFFYCRDCDIDFLVKKEKKGVKFCPSCGENLYVEKLMELWIERPFNYKRPWTPEEDQMAVAGIMQGKTHEQISREMQLRTPDAVRRRLQQLRKNGVYYELSSMSK